MGNRQLYRIKSEDGRRKTEVKLDFVEILYLKTTMLRYEFNKYRRWKMEAYTHVI